MDVVACYAGAAQRAGPRRLTGPVLRTRSTAAREIYAAIATGGQNGYRELVDAVRAHRPLGTATSTAEGREWLSELALVIAVQAESADERALATEMFDVIADRHGVGELDHRQQLVYAQLLAMDGDPAHAAAVLQRCTLIPAVDAGYLRCDIERRSSAWPALFAAQFAEFGLDPVSVDPAAPTAFDGLTATPDSVVADGPLVSVIMPVYRPSAWLTTAVRSVLGQSWRNLELIVVDDGSGPEYAGRFAALRADERVRVIHQESNGGAYAARNRGLRAARGEFATFQDSDDWSHPRRIERQLAPLLADGGLLATRSSAVRAHDDLRHQELGYPARRINVSSLLIRRDDVLSAVGYFDPARKSSDMEYAFRLQAARGSCIHDVEQPLAYTRLRTESLSRADFTFGWAHPDRIAYQAAYREWHRGVAAGAPPVFTDGARPFPAPRSYLRRPPARYDVVLAGDWQPEPGGSTDAGIDAAVDEIAALRARGLTVGILQLEAVGRMVAERRQVDRQLQRLVNDGVIERVSPGEEASLVVVRDPAVLQFAPPTPLLRAAAVRVVARDPRDYPGLELAYDEQACTANARRLFGAEPSWEELPAPIDPARWHLPRRRRRSTRPVVGRVGSALPSQWPSSAAELLAAYPAENTLDVRILGAVDGARAVLGRGRPPAWLVYRGGRLSLRAFVHQLDFYAYFPADDVDAPPVELLYRAMAGGALVVLPPRFAELFGPAALYTPAAGLQDTVQSYYADPGRYAAQVAIARRHVGERRSPEAYTDHIVATRIGGNTR